jgi:glycosyltransferase involved in cell wall biosynthesis
MKKVLFLDPVSYTGSAYYSYSFAETLAKKGVNVTFAHSGGWILSTKARSFNTVELFIGTNNNWPRPIKGIAFVVSCIRLVFYAITNRYDIVHFQYLDVPWVELFFVKVIKLFGKKVYMTAHEIEAFNGSECVTAGIRRVLREGDLIFAHNQATSERLIASGIDQSKIAVMAHGGFEYFHGKKLLKTEYRNKIGLEGNKIYFLLFGTLTERKGVPILISAMDILVNRKERTDIHLLVVGRPVSSYDISKDISNVRERGLSSFITFRSEFVSDDVVEYYYRGCDLVVIPYLRIAESGVLRQAFSAGSSVVASNLEEFHDIAIDNENCVLFRTGDAEDLAAKISCLINDESRRLEIGKNAEIVMRTKYSWDKIVDDFLQYY